MLDLTSSDPVPITVLSPETGRSGEHSSPGEPEKMADGVERSALFSTRLLVLRLLFQGNPAEGVDAGEASLPA